MTTRRIHNVAGLLLGLALLGSVKVGAGETAKPGGAPVNAPIIAHIEKAPIIAATLAGKRIVAAGDYGIVVLSDDGKTFRQAKSVPTRTVLTSLFFLNEKQGWAAGHDGTVLATSDGGENWQVQRAEPGKDRVLMSIWFENAQHGLAVGQFGLALETDDGGKTWQERKLVDGEAGDRHLFQIFAGPDGLAFVAAEAGSLLRTTDGGRSWKAIQTDNKGSFWTGLVQKDGSVITAGMRGHVYRSGDKGLTWTAVPSGTQQSITGILSHDDGSIHLFGNSGVLLLSSQDHVMSFKLMSRVDRSNITAAVSVGQKDYLFSLNGLLPEK